MNYRIANYNDLPKMSKLFNEVVTEQYFIKPLTEELYIEKLLTNPDFDYESVFVVYDEEVLVGYAIGYLRKKYLENVEVAGIINSIFVKKEYRKQGIGSTLLKKLEQYFKEKNRKKIACAFFLPSCFEWYIPNTDNHDHPCAPGIRVNSPEYFFYIHRGYEPYNYQDAFHLNLVDYEISDSIKSILERNAKDNITIELYDKDKHYGLEQFYKDLNLYDFEKVIRANLELDNPYPFLVVAKENRIVGWTGAMWNEASGRGHFDGIAILEEVRGRGLGKALFSMLAYYNKNNGAKFMTFYTGQNNHARYIYMGAGFKIIQTFTSMQKKIQ